MELMIHGIKKDYGKIHALSGVSITFTSSLYGLLGPNGAGKSTLINLITDNIARQDGEILSEEGDNAVALLTDDNAVLDKGRIR